MLEVQKMANPPMQPTGSTRGGFANGEGGR